MPTLRRPRKGSLRFYPRKRAAKVLPSVNWKPFSSIKYGSQSILGFITYKVGMATAIVKDTTDKSMTFGKKIAIPVTILEAPNMKIFSIRFYKDNIPFKDIIVSNDKELKRKLRVPKHLSPEQKAPNEYDDVRVLAYSIPKQTSIKKTPDIIELAISDPDKHKKLEYAKSLIGKEISMSDLPKFPLLDTRGLTKGRGLSGAVKRFGIGLKAHKSEKGRRRPGSLGPWHPARVTFRTPMAGQLGFFTRINYNNNLILSSSIREKDINPKSGYIHYGKIKASYILIKGSVQGPAKRQVLITPSYRPSPYQLKKKYEFIELVNETK